MEFNTQENSWLAVSQYCDKLLQTDLHELEHPSTDAERTAYIRGRIYVAREILGIPSKQDRLPILSEVSY